ncbi:hypothetical protein F4806DRAFT_460145 [Annulohypoxylon nitens]|nr:hypothetical protein F4806DRAFT_460145 [Annulohypoxylon nitens]
MPSLRNNHVCTELPCTYCRGEQAAQLKISQGLCSNLTCGNYLDTNSSTFCTEHLRRSSHTGRSSYYGNQSHNGRPLSRSYQDSVSGSSRTGLTTSTQTPSITSYSTASYPSSQASSRRSTRSYSSPQNHPARPPYSASGTSSSASAAGARFNSAWSSTISGQSRAPPSQASSYDTTSSTSSFLHTDGFQSFLSASSFESDSQVFDDDIAYYSEDEYGYEVPHTSPNHYSRPLPEATPSQQWIWPNYHENWPIQDRHLYRESYY